MKNIQIGKVLTIPVFLAVISGTWYAVQHLFVSPRDFEINALREQVKSSKEESVAYQQKVDKLERQIADLQAKKEVEKPAYIPKRTESKQAVHGSPGAIQAGRDVNIAYQKQESTIEPALLDSLISITMNGNRGYNTFLQYNNDKLPLMIEWITQWEGAAEANLSKVSRAAVLQLQTARNTQSALAFTDRSIQYSGWMNRLKFQIEALNGIISRKGI